MIASDCLPRSQSNQPCGRAPTIGTHHYLQYGISKTPSVKTFSGFFISFLDNECRDFDPLRISLPDPQPSGGGEKSWGRGAGQEGVQLM